MSSSNIYFDEKIESFFNDLDLDEINVVLDLVGKLDPLSVLDGNPLFSTDEIDVIQKFKEFSSSLAEEMENEDEEDEGVHYQ